MGYKGPLAISDRSGFRFPMREMVIEPGTKLLVHRSESDGKWNMVDHPLNHIEKYATLSGDPKPVKNARPDIDHVVDMYITNEDDVILTNQTGAPLEIY